MEMRGTGRSCAAAPKVPPAFASVSLVGSLDIVISSSLTAAAAGATDLRNCAGLLCRLGGHRGFALAVFLEHGEPALCVVGIKRLGRDQIARIGHHGGEIVPCRAAELRRWMVRRCGSEIGRPVAAGLRMGLIADVAEPYVVGIRGVR